MVAIIIEVIITIASIITTVVKSYKKKENAKKTGIIMFVFLSFANLILFFVTYEISKPQIYTTNGNATENNYICIKAGWKEKVYYTLESYADPAIDGIEYTNPIPITGSVAVSAKSRLFTKWSDLAERYIVLKNGTLIISNTPKVKVPDVVGNDRTIAEKALIDNGLTANVSEQYSNDVGEGIVISQTVEAGTEMYIGSTVGIVISKGSETVGVPNVVGVDRSSAISALQEAGFKVNEGASLYSDRVTEGYVISQDIAGGSLVKNGSIVTIIVSKGQELVTVPVVIGLTYSDAESQLSQQGLKAARSSEEYSETIPAGSVVSQSVSAGSSTAKNTTITLTISKGRQPFTVSFNSDGGTIVDSIMVAKGDTLSNANLPTSTKDYNNFGGWTYNGASVDGMTVTGDMTLTAAWSTKAASDWVAVGSVPAGANIIDKKWTYTVTTTETTWSRGDAPLEAQGYVRTGNETWELNSSGSAYYCNGFPDGEFKNNTGLADSVPWTAASNDIYRLDVITDWAGYVYWHWMYDSGGTEYGQYTRNISQRSGYGTAIKNFYYKYYGEFTSTSDYQKGSSGYNNNTGWTTYVNTGRTSYAENQGTDRWFRFDYYKASYEEYYKYIEYSLTIVDSYETTTGEPSGEGVGNIVPLVRYIPK